MKTFKCVWLVMLLMISMCFVSGAYASNNHGGGGHPGGGHVAGTQHAGSGSTMQHNTVGRSLAGHDAHNAGHSGHGYGGHNGVHNYHHFAHDWHHMNARDRGMWRGGNWRHDYYGGRYGWWWTVGGVWYFYDTPVYPYPTVVVEPFFPVAQEVQVQVAAPVVFPRATVIHMYYCPGVGYSPQVQTCPQGWITK